MQIPIVKYVFMVVFRPTYAYIQFHKIRKYVYEKKTYSISTSTFFQNTTGRRANTLILGVLKVSNTFTHSTLEVRRFADKTLINCSSDSL